MELDCQKMEEFPELYDLLGFFEAEPELTDRDVPWSYNCLTYRTVRGSDKIYCEIEPAGRQIVLIWERGNDLVASINLEQVSCLRVSSKNGTEKLIAKFKPFTDFLDFEFQLKPTIHIKWGNQNIVPIMRKT